MDEPVYRVALAPCDPLAIEDTLLETVAQAATAIGEHREILPANRCRRVNLVSSSG
jgi:hypothetical protein